MGPSPLFYKQIASRWAGVETSLAMPVEGKTAVCLLDSGARCNECTPEFIVERDLRFLPITDVDWVPENFMLVGLGGYLVRPMGVTVMEVDTPGLSIGGKQDHIFFVVEDPSNYRRRIPVILGSNYLKYMVEATKESEAANLPEEMQIAGQAYKATSHDPVFGPYAQRHVTFSMDEGIEQVKPAFPHPDTNTGVDPMDLDDVVITTKEVIIRPFSSTVIHGRTKRVMPIGTNLHVMTCAAPVKGKALKECLTVVDSFSTMTKGSRSVTVLLRNDSAQVLRVPHKTVVARVCFAREVEQSRANDDVITSALDEKFGPDPDEPEEIVGVAARQTELLKRLEENGSLNSLEEWPEDLKQKAKDLLCEYHDIFSLHKKELGHTDLGSHEIHLSDDTPFKDRYGKIPVPMMTEVREEVDRMRATGVIRPSQSPWNNPVQLVRKKDGSLRFCVDFRKLNAKTRKDAYPLPRINEALEALKGAQYFSVMDQSSGFHQVPMDEKAIPYTAFSVASLGMYEFTRMPFGLCNAPATFQRLMQECLGELNMEYALIYLDDVVVFSKDREGALERLRAVFNRFRRHNLKLKPSKCQFFKKEITYLAHKVDKDGIRPAADNLKAIAAFPVPVTYTNLRGFLGIVGHYRRFIKDFARKAEPLFQYLKGDTASKKDEKLNPPITAGSAAMGAYDLLKEAVMSTPVLAFADYSKPFLLETDASGLGLGAVLSQKQNDGKYHPVAFGSRSLKPAEKKYHSSRLEFLALKWAVTEHFEEYLRFGPFTVRTDNNPLTYVLTTGKLNACGIRWAQELASFDFDLEYLKGKNNGAADALSRMDDRLPPDEVERLSQRMTDLNHKGRATLGAAEVREILDGAAGEKDDADAESQAQVDTDEVANMAPEEGSIIQRHTQPHAGDHSQPQPQPHEESPSWYRWDVDTIKELLEDAVTRPRNRADASDPRLQQEADEIELLMQTLCQERLMQYSRGVYNIRGIRGLEVHQRRAQIKELVEWGNLQKKDPVVARVMAWKRKLGAWYDAIRKYHARKDDRRFEVPPPRPDLETILGNLAASPNGKAYLRVRKRLVLVDGKLYLREKYKKNGQNMLLFVVPRECRQLAINFCHDDSGHQGRDRTLSLIKERMWWPGMHQTVLDAIQNCWRCRKFEAPPVRAKMVPLRATRPNELVHIDFLTLESDLDIQKLAVKPVKLMVIQDHFSKYVQVAIAEDEKADTVAWLLYNSWYRFVGLPARILTDQGPAFNSTVFRCLQKWLGVMQSRTSSYHPQTNGLVERFNQTLKNMLGKLAGDRKVSWPNYLASAILAYNCTRSAVTGYSPYFLMFGRRPYLPVDFYFPIIRDPPQETKKISKQVVDIVTTLRECCVEARKQNALESKRQTRLYNRGFNASTLQVGDKVLLKTDAFKGKRKLKDNWSDEVYTVIRQMGENIPTFEIEAEDGKVRVAHRNRLLLYEPPRGAPLPPLADAPDVNHGPQPMGRDGMNRDRDDADRNRDAIGRDRYQEDEHSQSSTQAHLTATSRTLNQLRSKTWHWSTSSISGG